MQDLDGVALGAARGGQELQLEHGDGGPCAAGEPFGASVGRAAGFEEGEERGVEKVCAESGAFRCALLEGLAEVRDEACCAVGLSGVAQARWWRAES